MPIYEYKCPQGHVFELFQRMTDPAPEGCEVCGAGPVEKLLYPVAVHFKGSGFYTTDYKKKAAAKADGDGGDSKGDSKSESKSDSGSDSKSSTESKPSSSDKAGKGSAGS